MTSHSDPMARERTLLWCAWYELNTIRARDGVPYMHDGFKASVSEGYFYALVENMADALGDDAKPWPAEWMKPYIPKSFEMELP